MKNAVLGIIGGLLIIYTAVIALTIYGIQTRKNEVENVLSQIVVDTLKEHYVPEILRDIDYRPDLPSDIEAEIRDELALRITSDTEVRVTVLACDMDNGILSVRVDETYYLFNGAERNYSYAKTAIVDIEKR
jgi:hypothetical protein